MIYLEEAIDYIDYMIESENQSIKKRLLNNFKAGVNAVKGVPGLFNKIRALKSVGFHYTHKDEDAIYGYIQDDDYKILVAVVRNGDELNEVDEISISDYQSYGGQAVLGADIDKINNYLTSSKKQKSQTDAQLYRDDKVIGGVRIYDSVVRKPGAKFVLQHELQHARQNKDRVQKIQDVGNPDGNILTNTYKTIKNVRNVNRNIKNDPNHYLNNKYNKDELARRKRDGKLNEHELDILEIDADRVAYGKVKKREVENARKTINKDINKDYEHLKDKWYNKINNDPKYTNNEVNKNKILKYVDTVTDEGRKKDIDNNNKRFDSLKKIDK